MNILQKGKLKKGILELAKSIKDKNDCQYEWFNSGVETGSTYTKHHLDDHNMFYTPEEPTLKMRMDGHFTCDSVDPSLKSISIRVSGVTD